MWAVSHLNATSKMVMGPAVCVLEMALAVGRGARTHPQTADAIKLRIEDSWSPKKTSETTETTAIMHKIRPYSTRPWPSSQSK